MTYNVKPGDVAIIIDSAHGKNGRSVGRKVRVHSNNPEHSEYVSDSDRKWSEMHNDLNNPYHYCPPSPYEKEHTVLGKIWPVTCINGGSFTDFNGQNKMCVDVADRWLRKVEEVDGENSNTEKKELEKLD